MERFRIIHAPELISIKPKAATAQASISETWFCAPPVWGIPMRGGRRTRTTELSRELACDAGAKGVCHGEDMVVDLVVVGHICGVVAFEVVYCLGESLVKVHLHVHLEVSRGHMPGLAALGRWRCHQRWRTTCRRLSGRRRCRRLWRRSRGRGAEDVVAQEGG